VLIEILFSKGMLRERSLLSLRSNKPFPQDDTSAFYCHSVAACYKSSKRRCRTVGGVVPQNGAVKTG